jgi:ribosome assembly protein YihI (activator of Der GTPase)
MNIHTVAANLRRTIAGKELALKEYNKALNVYIDPLDVGERMAITATKEFLEINIAELKRILADVESCVAKDVEQSWRLNPDRSGGQFTQEEIDNAGRW